MFHRSTNTGNEDWGNCNRCNLHATRRRVALRVDSQQGRKNIHLLFIGEAPGEVEDTIGIPFVGTSGRILNIILGYVQHPFSWTITNTVCCRPMTMITLDEQAVTNLNEGQLGTDYEIIDKNREPSQKEIELCKPHIDQIVASEKPDGIVYLGKVSESYQTRLPKLKLYHPAYIARLEYRLLTMLKEAHQIDKFIERLTNAKTVMERSIGTRNHPVTNK